LTFLKKNCLTFCYVKCIDYYRHNTKFHNHTSGINLAYSLLTVFCKQLISIFIPNVSLYFLTSFNLILRIQCKIFGSNGLNLRKKYCTFGSVLWWFSNQNQKYFITFNALYLCHLMIKVDINCSLGTTFQKKL